MSKPTGTDSVHNADNNGLGDTAKNLPRLTNGHDPDAVIAPQHDQQNPILLVDSDTTAVIAAQYLPPGWNVAAFDPTTQTNLGNVSHAVIWGRNDEGGRAWAQAVADTLVVPSHVVTIARFPAHWHLGDVLPAGRTTKQLTGYLAGAIARCQTRAIARSTRPATPVRQTIAAPAAPALAAVPQPPADNTDLDFIRNGARGDGAVKPIMKNASLLLQANPHRWDLRWNEFSARACLGSDPLTDHDILNIASWVQLCGVHASVATITDAIMAVAGNNRFHPVRSYLDGLRWDGIPRLDMLFVDHAGTPDTPLTRAVTSRWFIQAVARIYEPGCQADSTLVLEGVQGLKKSSFFRELFGDQWFTDHLPDITSKDALLQLRGVWCVEIGELATLGRAESAKIKQFLTSRVDRYRDPYGRVVADFPRTCVFSGSINPGAGGYLKDETGARRFWPVQISERINSVAAVGAARDQLWGEALHRYRAREPWYLDTTELEEDAHEVVSERFSSDPWQEKVDEFLGQRSEVTIPEVFRFALNVTEIGKWTQADMNRIGRCLAFSGWVRIRRGPPAARRWVYTPGPGAVSGTLALEAEEM